MGTSRNGKFSRGKLWDDDDDDEDEEDEEDDDDDDEAQFEPYQNNSQITFAGSLPMFSLTERTNSAPGFWTHSEHISSMKWPMAYSWIYNWLFPFPVILLEYHSKLYQYMRMQHLQFYCKCIHMYLIIYIYAPCTNYMNRAACYKSWVYIIPASCVYINYGYSPCI